MRRTFAILATVAAWGCGGGTAAAPGPATAGTDGEGGARCTAGTPQEIGKTDSEGQLGVTPVEGGALVALRPDRETIHLYHLKPDGTTLSSRVWLTGDVRPSIARPPVAVWNGQEYLVGWIEQPAGGLASLRARRVDIEGQAIGMGVIGVGPMEITGEAELLSVDGGFVGVWIAGLQLSGIRFADIDTEGMSVRRDTIDIGRTGLEDMRAEPVPGGILVTWKNGSVELTAGGRVAGEVSDEGGRARGDPRPPSWDGTRPVLPDDLPDWSEGLPVGERLAVAWAETRETSYGIKLGFFDRSGALAGGPYDVAETTGGTTNVPLGLAQHKDGIAVFWVDRPDASAHMVHMASCQ